MDPKKPINRRHHCRRCGRIVCNGCSSNAILIIEINPNIPVRVCDDCFNWSTKIQTNRKISTNSLDQQQQQQGWQHSTELSPILEYCSSKVFRSERGRCF